MVFYAVLALTFLVYKPGLDGGLILDDFANLSMFGEVAAGRWSLRDVITTSDAGPLGRPVAMASFAANFALTGDTARSLKATNLAIHLVCGCLVFWLVGRLSRESPPIAGAGWWLAAWTSGLWLLSPLFVSTVLYVIQRMAQLATLFSLLGLLLYTLGRQRLERSYRLGMTVLAGGVLLAWPAATLSKENGVLLPLLLFLLEYFWFRFRGSPRVARGLRCYFLLVLAIPALGAIGLAALLPERILGEYVHREFTLGGRLLTEARVLFDYLQALILPRGAAMGVFHDDYLLSTGWLSPPSTLIAVVGWVTVLAMAFRVRLERGGSLLFGVVFFLAAQLLESSVLPLEIYFEHRNYLPGFGIYLSLALGLGFAISSVGNAGTRQWLLFFAVAMVILFAVATLQRVLVWRSWDTILLTDVESHPDSVRVHSDLASTYAQRGDLGRALEQLDEVDRLRGGPGSATALHRMLIYCQMGLPVPEEAYEGMERLQAFDRTRNTEYVLTYLVRHLERRGHGSDLDVPRLARVLKRWYASHGVTGDRKLRRNLHLGMAAILRLANDRPAAYAQLMAAMEIFPERLEAGLIFLRYQLEDGLFKEASGLVKQLRVRDRGRVPFHTELLNSYERLLVDVEQFDNAGRVPLPATGN